MIFVDTWAWIGLAVKQDQYHAVVKARRSGVPPAPVGPRAGVGVAGRHNLTGRLVLLRSSTVSSCTPGQRPVAFDDPVAAPPSTRGADQKTSTPFATWVFPWSTALWPPATSIWPSGENATQSK